MIHRSYPNPKSKVVTSSIIICRDTIFINLVVSTNIVLPMLINKKKKQWFRNMKIKIQ